MVKTETKSEQESGAASSWGRLTVILKLGGLLSLAETSSWAEAAGRLPESIVHLGGWREWGRGI